MTGGVATGPEGTAGNDKTARDDKTADPSASGDAAIAGPKTGERPVVAQIITTLVRGGAQATVMASVDMADRGMDVVVLAGRGGDEPGSFWDDIDRDSSTVIPVPHLVREPAPIRDLRALLWLIRWLRAERPDVVHTHSSKAGVLGRLAAAAVGIPCAHTVHGWGPLYATNRVAARAAAAIERFLAGLCQALVVVGRLDLGHGLAHRIGKPGLYRVIHSGIDTAAGAAAAEDREAIRSELGLADRLVIGMTARMAHPKDHATLVAAFEQAAVPDSMLVLLGDGPQRSVIERQVAEAGLVDRVRFLGQRSDAARLVAAFDLAVLSSRWEGMPRSVVEAVAASVPVVATDVGSISDLIDDGISGRLVAVGDAPALAAILVDAAERPAAYRDMAAVAGRRVEAYSVDRMQDELADLWLQLAATGPSHPEVEPGLPVQTVEQQQPLIGQGRAPSKTRAARPRPILSDR